MSDSTEDVAADEVAIEQAEPEEDPMEDLFPRVDISPQLTDSLIQKLGDAQWKIRKEGLDEVAAILESANKRLAPSIGRKIPMCL